MKCKISIFLAIFFLYMANLYSLSLDRCVQIALEHNYSLLAKKNEIKSIDYIKKSAESAKMPSIFFDSSYTVIDDSKEVKVSTPYFSSNFEVANSNYADVTTGVNFTIYSGGAISSNIKSKKFLLDIAKEDYEEIKLEIIKEVKKAYIDVLKVKAIKKAIEKEVKSYIAHLNDVEEFYKKGLVAYIDLLETKVNLAKSKQRLTKINNDFKVAKSKLNIIMGQNIDYNWNVEDVNIKNFKIDSFNNLEQIALKNRPILRKILISLEKIEADKKIIKSKMLPKIFLTSGYSYSDMQKDIDNKGSFFIKGGVKFNIDWDKPANEMTSLEEKKNSLKNVYENEKLKIKLQVKKSYLDYISSLKNFDVAKENLEQAKEYFRLITEKYKSQLANNTEVVDAINYLTMANTDKIIAYYGILKSIFEIERAIGKR